MRTKTCWVLAWTIIFFMPHVQGANPDEWEVAHEKAMNETIKRIKRLDPFSFSPLAVPDDVVKKLKKLGCKIPQAATIHEPHNIINGEFARLGQTDWAALCSREPGTSFILVLWGEKRPCPSEIVSSKNSDKDWIRFPIMSNGSPPIYGDMRLDGYLRIIRKATSKYFRDSEHGYPAKGGNKFTNEGIVESFSIDGVDTNSYYCMNGKWRKWSENAGD